MRHFVILFIHLIVSRPARPAGGLRSVVAESVLVRHQLRILNRSRKRAPNLRTSERVIAGLCALFMNPAHLLRSAIVLKPSTLPHLHQLLAKRKYRMLFSPQHGRPPGPKGPNRELIQAVVELKRRNPNWGCPRIAQQITLAFGVEIDKRCCSPYPMRSLFAFSEPPHLPASRLLSRFRSTASTICAPLLPTFEFP